MPSEVSREVGAAVRWLIVGIALGVLPTYVLLNERAKKESAAAANAAAMAAASSVYAAWSATPPPVCPAPPITVPTVVAVTGNGGGGTAPQRPTRVNPAGGSEVDETQMMLPMLNMMQGMMGGDGTGAPTGSGMPDMSQLMKDMPKQ